MQPKIRPWPVAALACACAIVASSTAAAHGPSAQLDGYTAANAARERA